jgi:hypothetical protein
MIRLCSDFKLIDKANCFRACMAFFHFKPCEAKDAIKREGDRNKGLIEKRSKIRAGTTDSHEKKVWKGLGNDDYSRNRRIQRR